MIRIINKSRYKVGKGLGLVKGKRHNSFQQGFCCR